MRELTNEEVRYLTLALDEQELQELIEKGRKYHIVSPIITIASQIKDQCQGYRLTITFQNGHFSWDYRQIKKRKTKRDAYEYIVDGQVYESPEDIIKALGLETEWQNYKDAGENLGKGPLNFLKRKQKIKVEKREKSDEKDES